MIETHSDKAIRYEANLLQQEARIILPGIQTLFGFQLVAVFNEAFFHRLSHNQQIWHLMAMGLSIVAAAFGVAPAAYNRRHAMNTVSIRFLKIANGWLRWTLMPLSLALAIDFGLIVVMVIEDLRVAITVGCLTFIFLTLLWYGTPGMDTSAPSELRDESRPGDHSPERNINATVP